MYICVGLAESVVFSICLYHLCDVIAESNMQWVHVHYDQIKCGGEGDLDVNDDVRW